MPKIKKEDSTDPMSELISLLKAKTPGLFEREPAPAFSETKVRELAELIITLLD